MRTVRRVTQIAATIAVVIGAGYTTALIVAMLDGPGGIRIGDPINGICIALTSGVATIAGTGWLLARVVQAMEQYIAAMVEAAVERAVRGGILMEAQNRAASSPATLRKVD